MADPYSNAKPGGLGGASAPVAGSVPLPPGVQPMAQYGQNTGSTGGMNIQDLTDEEAAQLLSAMGAGAPPGVSPKAYLQYSASQNPAAVGAAWNKLSKPQPGETPEIFRARLAKTFGENSRLANTFQQAGGQTKDEIAAQGRESEKAAYDKGMAGLRDQYSSLYGQYQKAAAPYLDPNSPEAQAQRQMVSQQVMHGVDRQAMSRGLGGAGYSMNVQGQANTLAQNQLADQRAQMGANILGQGMNALSGLGNAIQQPYQTGLGAQQWDRQFAFTQDQAKRQEALQRAQMQANQTASIIGGVGSVVGGLGSLIPGVGPAVSGLASGLSRGIGGAAGGASLANYQGPAGRNF